MTVVHPVPAEPSGSLIPATPPKVTVLTTSAPEPGGWSAPEHADETTREYRTRLVLAIGLLLAITTADLLLITSTFNRVLRDAVWLSWVLGVSLTLASVAAAYIAGAYTRRYDADPRTRRARTLAAGLVLGWVALGVGMFVLRWQAASFAPPAIAYDGAQAASAEEFKERLLAVVLAAVYLVTGVLAFVDGYKFTNPAAAALRSARARLDALLSKLNAQEGRVARLRENLEVATNEYEMLPAELTNAISARDALAEELKAHARVQLALHLGDPASTGVVRPTTTGPATGAPSPEPNEATVSSEGEGEVEGGTS